MPRKYDYRLRKTRLAWFHLFIGDVAVSERFVPSDRIVGLHFLCCFHDMFVCTWYPQIAYADSIVRSARIAKRTVTGVRKLFGS